MNPRAYWRFIVVVRQFLPLAIAYARDRRRFLLFGGTREVSSQERRRRASKLLESLITLGPTFIKLGQLLSTRPDILPPEYIAEFTKLQDDVPPAEWEETREVIEDELGPIDQRFDAFDTDPISGASLGQVYVARVDGDPVAVKVRRPGVQTLVQADLRVIRWLLPILMYFVDEARSFSLETLADEFDKRIRQEMDYEREAEMLREIRGNFADNDDVRMPAVIDTHSTGRVLTMEYIGGTKITNLERLDELGIDQSDLATILQRAYLQMVVEDGVFHGDPHPGNLAVMDDGTLVFYDFGMSGFVDSFVQDRLLDFYTAVARQDTDAILDTLVEMGTLSPDANREVIGEILELAIQDVKGEDIDQYRVQQIVQQLEDTIYEFPLRLPSNLALVLRVATVVEGVCVTLDPDFDFISVSTSYLREQGYFERGAREYVQDRGEELRDAAGSALRVPPKLETVLDRLDRGTVGVEATLNDESDYFDRLGRRVVLSVVFGAGIVSTTMLYTASAFVEAAALGAGTAVCGLILAWSFRRDRGFRGEPKFTRYEMRKDEADPEQLLGFDEEGTTTDDGPRQSPLAEDTQPGASPGQESIEAATETAQSDDTPAESSTVDADTTDSESVSVDADTTDSESISVDADTSPTEDDNDGDATDSPTDDR